MVKTIIQIAYESGLRVSDVIRKGSATDIEFTSEYGYDIARYAGITIYDDGLISNCFGEPLDSEDKIRMHYRQLGASARAGNFVD